MLWHLIWSPSCSILYLTSLVLQQAGVGHENAAREAARPRAAAVATDVLTKACKTIVAAASKHEVSVDMVKKVLGKWRAEGCTDAVVAAVAGVVDKEPDSELEDAATLTRVKMIDLALGKMKSGMSSRDAAAWCVSRGVQIIPLLGCCNAQQRSVV